MSGFKFTGEGERFFKRMEELQNISVQVGFEGEEADAAAYAEFGTSSAPARPFMSEAIDKHSAEITELSGRLSEQFLEGTISKDELCQQLGEAVKGFIKEELATGTYAPSAQSTVNERGPALPLSGLADKIVVKVGG